MGTVDRPLAPTPPHHFWNPNSGRDNSVGSLSAMYANNRKIDPHVLRSWIFFALPLIKENQAVIYWPKEWVLGTSQLPTEDLSRYRVVK